MHTNTHRHTNLFVQLPLWGLYINSCYLYMRDVNAFFRLIIILCAGFCVFVCLISCAVLSENNGELWTEF